VARLSKLQNGFAERLLEIATSGSDFPPSVLLVGPSGVGKRTIASFIADARGMRFVEVPVNDSAKRVGERLLGTEIEASRAQQRRAPPGELGDGQPTLLYLSGLEAIDADRPGPTQDPDQ